MDDSGDSDEGGRRLIDEAAKARFLETLYRTGSRDAAAEAAGFPLGSLYNARARDPVFRLAWTWGLDLAAVERRAAADSAAELAAGDEAAVRIAAQGGRLLQRRRMRWTRFTEARQQIFLNHFAGTADNEAAAAAAGVCAATVNAHRRKNPEFDAAWHEALAQAYALLEAEAVRQRLETQRRLCADLEPAGEMTDEFERVMKLLARWDRGGGRIGPRESRPGPGRAWSFDEAIGALDRKLRALGLRRGIAPPPDGEGDRPEAGGGGASLAPQDEEGPS